jgi:replication initiation protein RepC
MLLREGHILRSMTNKVHGGTWPMVMVLLRAWLDEGKHRQTVENATSGPGPRLKVSDSLLNSLRKRNPLTPMGTISWHQAPALIGWEWVDNWSFAHHKEWMELDGRIEWR